MHAVTLAKLVKPLEARRQNPDFAMLDIGCGTGYSTLLYADLASQILHPQKNDFVVVGIDFYDGLV